MKGKSKLTKVMLWLFFVPLVIDMISTGITFIREGHTLSEANLLFIMLGGNVWLFGGIILLLSFFWYWLIVRDSGITFKWIMLSLIVWLLLVRIYAVYGHIMHFITPVSLEVAQTSAAFTPAAKTTWYVYLIGLFVYLPIFMQWLTLKLFRIDYDIVKKEAK